MESQYNYCLQFMIQVDFMFASRTTQWARIRRGRQELLLEKIIYSTTDSIRLEQGKHSTMSRKRMLHQSLRRVSQVIRWRLSRQGCRRNFTQCRCCHSRFIGACAHGDNTNRMVRRHTVPEDSNNCGYGNLVRTIVFHVAFYICKSP